MRSTIAAAGVLMALATASPAPAAVVTFDFGVEFSGATPPEGPGPWLTATLEDIGADLVKLTMSTAGLTDNEFITGWYFNLNPALNPNSLVLDWQSGGVTDTNSVENTGVNMFQADGDGLFDILFGFPTGGGPAGPSARFTAGETLVYHISGLSGLTATDFDFLSCTKPECPSAGGNGPFKSAAKVQGIGPSDAQSGWVGVNGTTTSTGTIGTIPEPTLLALLGMGGLALGYRLRRRFA